ncbi:MAG: M28 family peptidase, partial [Oricola sp.]|nr:M28 family peptidase [Oricola sp.]
MQFRLALRSSLCAPLALLAACASVEPGSVSPGIDAAVATAETAGSPAARLEADIAWLADDAREGREAGLEGYREAAEYVAARMETMGLEPGADGSWFQEVPFVSGTAVQDAARMSVSGPDGKTVDLVNIEDFRVFPSMSDAAFSLDGVEAVFVGYGIHAPAFGYDDYEGVDVKGKIVVAFSGAPDIFDTESSAHFNSGGLKAQVAAERGAVGVISLYTKALETSRPWARMNANPNYSVMTWVGPDGKPDVSGPGVRGSAMLNPEAAPLLFKGASRSYADARAAADGEGEPVGSFELAVKISMAGAMNVERTSSPNVVGLIPGSDPQLKDEYVVLTAHLDHIGVSQRLILEGKDGVNNGAMDNATGVATLLEAARAFMADEPPARSVMIVAVTAEEKGLLGADYFAHFPPIGEGEMVANVNLDMPVMLYEFTDVVAFGAERSSIGPIMQAALDAEGIALSPDPIP